MEDTMRNDRQAVFTYLMNSRSMVDMTVGAVIGGVVQHDYVVVRKAAPRVVQEIVGSFRHVGLTENGLLIPLTPID
jgi:hypothetical protein